MGMVEAGEENISFPARGEAKDCGYEKACMRVSDALAFIQVCTKTGELI